jgi:hypothetical protein
MKRCGGFELVTGFIGHTQLLIAIHYGYHQFGHLQFTTYALSLPNLLSLHQSSGNGFQQWTFPFLGS